MLLNNFLIFRLCLFKGLPYLLFFTLHLSLDLKLHSLLLLLSLFLEVQFDLFDNLSLLLEHLLYFELRLFSDGHLFSYIAHVLLLLVKRRLELSNLFLEDHLCLLRVYLRKLQVLLELGILANQLLRILPLLLQRLPELTILVVKILQVPCKLLVFLHQLRLERLDFCLLLLRLLCQTDSHFFHGGYLSLRFLCFVLVLGLLPDCHAELLCDLG